MGLPQESWLHLCSHIVAQKQQAEQCQSVVHKTPTSPRARPLSRLPWHALRQIMVAFKRLCR